MSVVQKLKRKYNKESFLFLFVVLFVLASMAKFISNPQQDLEFFLRSL